MFTAYFQNVLEIRLYDSDKPRRDDLISLLLFDISQLRLGQKETKLFIIHPEVTFSFTTLMYLAMHGSEHFLTIGLCVSIFPPRINCGLNLSWKRGKNAQNKIQNILNDLTYCSLVK